LSTFVDQPGVPVVSVDLDCSASPVLHLAQGRYQPLGIEAQGDPRWRVPMCIRANDTHCIVLTERTMDLPLSGGCPTVVQADVGAVGYYRVAYSAPLLEALLAKKDGPIVERVGTVDNATALAEGGHLDAGIVLRATPELAKEEPDVVRVAMDFVSGFDAHLVSDEQRPAYQRFIRSTFGPVVRAWGLVPQVDEPAAVRLARPTGVRLVALLGEDDALATEVTARVNEWLGSRSGLDPSLVGAALAIAAHRGDRVLFDRIRAEVTKETDQHRREQLIQALGQFPDPALVHAALDLTLTDELDVRDAFGMMDAAFTDRRSRDASWAWLESNVDRLADKLPTAARPYLVEAGEAWCDPVHRAQVHALFADRSKQWIGAAYALAQTEQKIDACIATTAVQQDSVERFLAGY
jgi:alanyl aminopeptidase